MQSLMRIYVVCLTTFNVVVYSVECQTWEQLLDRAAEPTQISIGKEGNNFYLEKPLTSTLQLDLATSNMKKGGFKLAAFGSSMPAVFKAGSAEAICAKRTYNAVERVVEVDGLLTKKVVNVPHEGEMQFQHLTMEVSCLVWAQALLDLIYDFIKESEGPQSYLSIFHSSVLSRRQSRLNNLHQHQSQRRQLSCSKRLLMQIWRGHLGSTSTMFHQSL
jgi:hypothetical protein